MNLFGPHQKVGLAICSPHRKRQLPNGQWVIDTVSVEWHRRRTALGLPTNCNFIEFFADGMEVGDARTQVVYRCLQHNPQPKYLFFLDDDVLPDHDALTKLYYRLQTNPNIDVACGVYCCKGQIPSDPLIYKDFGEGGFWDWAIGDILTTNSHGIKACHMGLTLIRMSLFQKMLDKGIINDTIPFFKTVSETERVNGVMKNRQGTEDLWFFSYAEDVDCQILVDTSVLAGHYDKNTGITWGLPEDSPPVQRAKWLHKDDRKEAEVENLKIALDIGAGETRRQWSGYKTYTLDIRPEAKPDYCQDSRYLNLPDNHFDLVASSHHFEHIGRWEQQQIWKEAFRVCKPDGCIEIIVPSIEWAAHKITEGQADEHVLNVLYGAQELHGYERTLNLHYFGYTKSIGKALAEEAGFVDVVCQDWRDNENQFYNLIIKGKKPQILKES